MSRFFLFLLGLAAGHASSACAQVRQVASGFVYTEGPAADCDGNLYFTDYKDGPGKIYRLGVDGDVRLVVAASGRANGLAIAPSGEIIACQVDGRVAAFRPDGAGARVLTATFGGKRYNAPNDLVLDSAGGVYFTDPRFDAPWPLPQRVTAVYYLSAGGEVTRLIDDLASPNGIGLSPDGQTLYVVPSFARHVYAYPVLGPGRLGAGRKFCRLAPSVIPFIPGGDGMTLDRAGNLYVATLRGVQVFDPAGEPLGLVRVPGRPSNVAFGGPGHRTLFITVGGAVYAATGPLPADSAP